MRGVCEREALPLAIFGDQAGAADGDGVGSTCHRRPEHRHFSGRDRVGAIDRPRHLRTAGADEPRQADDLARAHAKIDTPDAGGGDQVAHVERHLARHAEVRAIVDDAQRASDHQRDHGFGRGIGGQRRCNAFAVAQNGDPIAEREHFLHPVRDVDDGHTRGTQSADHGEQRLALAIRQCCGRFIHDQDARVLRQRLGDLHHLLLRDTQVDGECAGVVIESERMQYGERLAMHARVIDQAGPADDAARGQDRYSAQWSGTGPARIPER